MKKKSIYPFLIATGIVKWYMAYEQHHMRLSELIDDLLGAIRRG